MNITSIMMDLVKTAEELGIETEGKSREQLVREIRLAEQRSYNTGPFTAVAH